MAALLSLSAVTSACTTSNKARPVERVSGMKVDVERVATPRQAVFAGVVRDEYGTPLPGARVMIWEQVTNRILQAITDDSGTFTIPSVSDGIYRVEVTLPGLYAAVIEHLPLKQDETACAEVTMRPNTLTVTVGVLTADSGMTTSDAMTTTFSQEFINTIPRGN